MRAAAASQSSSPNPSYTTTKDSGEPHITMGGAQRLSCLECQKRKAKCDKQIPCATCKQRGIVCHPAASDPDKPRKKRFPEAELLARIRKYEDLLTSNGLLKDCDTLHPGRYSKEGGLGTCDAKDSTRKRSRRSSIDSSSSSSAAYARCEADRPNASADMLPTPPRTAVIEPDISHLESIFGTVTPLSTESHFTPQQSDYGMQKSSAKGSHQPNEFNQSLSVHTINKPAAGSEQAALPAFMIHKHLNLMFPDDGSSLFHFDDHCPGENLQHPDTSLMFRLLHLYQQNIHPLVKIVHIPTVRERLCDITSDPSLATNQDNALFFAMYSTVMMTLTPEDTERLFHTRDKSAISESFRRNAQTALCRAGIWRPAHLTNLQAYLLYLISVSKDTDPRTLAIFMASAVRIAQRVLFFQSRGIVPDSLSHGALGAVNEMAHRVWWEMLTVDLRISEKAGIPSSPSLATAITPMPRNVSDEDLEQPMAPDQPSVPAALSTTELHTPDTDCLFLLLRCELNHFQLHPPWSQHAPDDHLQHQPFRRSTLYRQAVESCKRPHWSALSCRLAAVNLFDEYIFRRYFDRPEAASNTIILFAHHHARIWLAKMRLIVHLNQRDAKNEPEIIKLCAIQVEETVKLIADVRFVRFQWFTYSHLPFYSMFVLLDLLRRHTRGDLVDRAWKAISDSAIIWRVNVPDGEDGGKQSNGAQSNETTPSTSSNQSFATRGTPLPPATSGQVDEAKFKLQVRGTMLAQLLVAAWEKRAEALLAEHRPQLDLVEPAIVTVMRETAAMFQMRSQAADSQVSPQTERLHTGASRSQHQQFAPALPDGGAFAETTSFNTLWEPAECTFDAVSENVQHFNSLLQSSIDLDWSSWLGQSWDPSAGAGSMGSPAQYLPSF